MFNNRIKRDEPTYRAEAEPASLPARFKSWPGTWQVWLSIVLLFLALEIAVLSVERAGWIAPQPSLTLVLVLSVLITWWLVRSRFPGAVKHLLGLVIGIVVTLGQAYSLIPVQGVASRLAHLFTALHSWWQATGAVISGEEILAFAVFLSFLTWVIGYVSMWLLLRKQNAWVGVSLGAAVVLVNLSNLPDRYYFFFGAYFLAAMGLLTQTRIARQGYFSGHSLGYARRVLLYLAVSLLCLAVLAGSIAWVTPQMRVPQLQTAVATRILWKKGIEDSPLNFFATVPAKQPLSTSATRRDLSFKKDWHQGEQIDFIVESDHPSYWRQHVYDTYTSRGWTNMPTSDYILAQETPWGGAGTSADSGAITYSVTTSIKTDALLTAGDFISSDSPVLVRVSAGDIIDVTTPRVLSPGERYTATSSPYSPSQGQLASVAGGYPQSIADTYLQLPPDFPGDIRELSANLTRNARTPYEKVMAIDDYLSRIPYTNEIEAPPDGKDGVEHFLFTQKSGFCLYFASAMAVMLRSVDVPARLVVGYLPGDPGREVGQYILRDKHYHTWPQAYFAGYGWIDLEATPRSTGSQVSVYTPWVSGGVIEELPQWNVWLPWEVLVAQAGGVGSITAGEPKPRGPRMPQLPFADALGKALFIIFTSVFFIMLVMSPVLALRSAFYRWLWHVDRSNLASRTYDKMCALASMVRLGPRPQQTPLEYAAELAAVFPQQARALDDIAHAYVENRFGRREGKLSLFEEAEILKARCSIYDMLLTRLGLAGKLFSKRQG